MTYLAAHGVAGFASTIFLLEPDHPLWAGLCFLLIAISIANERPFN
jgi:hypothetical protein